MRSTCIGSAALAAFLVFGCAEQGGESSDRGPIGKADLYGSCADPNDPTFTYCGGPSDGNCWCDENCDLFGDCCDDKATTCDGVNECVAGGGTCQALTAEGCDYGSRPASLSCGGPLGVMCCIECPQVMCTLYCEFGFKTDEYGCEICDCYEPLENACVEAGGSCEPLIAEGCPAGTQPASHSCGGALGVMCCMACPPVLCELYCEHGFQTNEYGCEICACAEPEPERSVAEGQCVRNGLEACSTDADCGTGGCGGELCFNPAEGNGYTTCDCFTPGGVEGCGCVNGQCAWYVY